jgi:hypothetical protein
MTVAELLMAVGISGVVLAAVAVLIFFSGRSYAALANYVDLDNRSRSALDRMSKEIRQVDCVTNSATATLPNGRVVTNRLVLSGTEPNGDTYTINYEYDPVAETLVRTKTGGNYPGTSTLLTGCSYLNFGMFQRVPKTNSFEQFDAADLATCKVVQLDWICSRKILNKTANTETIESTKVVIRKK